MARSQRFGIGAAALTCVVGLVAIVGCSAGLDGTPYGESGGAQKDDPNTEASTTGASLDAGRERPAHRTSTSSENVDAGFLGDAATAPGDASPFPVVSTPASSTPDCSALHGITCEDCCLAKIPGADALNDRIDAEYNDCLDAEGCFGDPNCEDFCDNSATNDICQGQPSLCDQIDSCIATNRCDN